jgi:uncharacterized phage protein (TIGR02218 family)
MTFSSKEISSQDGNSVALYLFKWGNTYWRYTSADRDLTFNDGTPGAQPKTYTAIAITDSGMKQGGSSNNDMTVNVQSDIPMVSLYRSTPPSGSIWLTIRRMHYDDGEALVHWVGTIGNVKFGDAESIVICRSLLATFKKTGLRLCWTRGCAHMLYDSECRVDPADFSFLGTVTAKTGNSVTVSGAAAGQALGYFNGGYIEWDANVDGTKDRRQINVATSVSVFTLVGTSDRIEIGTVLTFHPGCDLTTETCDVKFDNLANFGGLEQMSDESPFDGKPIA